MSFNNPWLLSLLLIVPLLVVLYLLAQRRRRAYAVRFTNLQLLASLVGRSPGFRRHLPTALFLLGLAGLVVGAAGPVLNLEVAGAQANVMLVIDVSGSMAATDVLPTRMDAARAAALNLVNQLPANAQVGLVSFNSTATVRAPLTSDRGAIGAALAKLQPGGGTAIGDGINAALQELQQGGTPAVARRQAPSLIVVLTDGSSNAGVDPAAAAQNALAAGIPVDTIGVGARDRPTFVHGQRVEGVDEAALQAIASATGGKYFYAEAAGQLSSIFGGLGSSIGWRFVRLDVMIPTLILGSGVLLVGGLLSLHWFRQFP